MNQFLNVAKTLLGERGVRSGVENVTLLNRCCYSDRNILSRKGSSFSYTVFSLRPGDPANAVPSRRSLVNLAKVILMRFTAKKPYSEWRI